MTEEIPEADRRALSETVAGRDPRLVSLTDWFVRRTWRAALLLALAAVLINFLGLGVTDAVSMEGIVADGARHMERTGQYMVPYLHGEIYSYKPPLANWLTLGSFRLFGAETEWSLRFPFAMSGLLMGLSVLLLTRRVARPGTAFLCGFASMTGVLMLQKLHLAEWDLLLSAAVGVAVAMACSNFAVRSRTSIWLATYLVLAAAFLVKGIPALMFFGPGLLVAALLTGNFREFFKFGHLAGVLIFLLCVGWWIVSAYQTAGWAAFEQPMAEARDKGFTWDLGYISLTLAKPILALACFLPWTLLLPISFRAAAWRSEPIRRMALAAGGFAAAGIVVFMAVPAYDSRYLLPVAVPMTMLCGLAAKDVLRVRESGWRRRSIQGLAILVGLGALVAAVGAEESILGSQGWLIVLGLVTLGAVARDLRLGGAPSAVGLLTLVAILGWLAQTGVVRPHRASSRSLRSIAASFDSRMNSDAELWTPPVSKDFRHSSLFFYLRRPVKTLATDGTGPEKDDFVVLFSDEHEEIISSVADRYDVVERREQRQYLYILARAREDSR